MFSFWFPRYYVSLVSLEPAAVSVVVVRSILAKPRPCYGLNPVPGCRVRLVRKDVELEAEVTFASPTPTGYVLVRLDVLEVGTTGTGEPTAYVGLGGLGEGGGVRHLEGVGGGYPLALLSGEAQAAR